MKANKLRTILNAKLNRVPRILTDKGTIYGSTGMSMNEVRELINVNSECYEASIYSEHKKEDKLCINLIFNYSDEAKEEEKAIQDILFYSGLSNFEIENYQ